MSDATTRENIFTPALPTDVHPDEAVKDVVPAPPREQAIAAFKTEPPRYAGG